MRHCCQPRVASTDCGMGGGWRRRGVDPDRTKEIFRMQTITYGRHEWRRRCQFYAHRTTRQRRPAFLRFRLCRCCTDTDRTLCTTDPDSGATTGPRIDFLPTLSLHNSQLHSSVLRARCGLVLKLLHLSLQSQAHLTVALRGYFTDYIAAEFRIYMKQKSGWVHPGGSTAEVWIWNLM